MCPYLGDEVQYCIMGNISLEVQPAQEVEMLYGLRLVRLKKIWLD